MACVYIKILSSVRVLCTNTYSLHSWITFETLNMLWTQYVCMYVCVYVRKRDTEKKKNWFHFPTRNKKNTSDPISVACVAKVDNFFLDSVFLKIYIKADRMSHSLLIWLSQYLAIKCLFNKIDILFILYRNLFVYQNDITFLFNRKQ